MKVTDSGIELISLPIQNLIEEQFSTQTGQLSFSWERAYMFGDPSDHKLHLMLPHPPDDEPKNNQLLVYDTYTNTWFQYGWNGKITQEIDTEGKLVVDYDNDSIHGLYYRKTNTCIWVNSTKVFTERKTYTVNDYVDDEYYSDSVVGIGMNPDVYQLGNRAIQLGYLPPYNFAGSVLEFNNVQYNIVAHLPDTWLVLDKPFLGTIEDTVAILSPVWTEVVYAPTYEVNAAALNHFREVNTLFKLAKFDYLRMMYLRPNEPSDTTGQAEAYITLNGVHEFGINAKPISHYQTRTIVPREQSRCSVLTVGFQMPVALAEPEIEGMVILFNPGPMKRRR
jgi:hypothetical protein